MSAERRSRRSTRLPAHEGNDEGSDGLMHADADTWRRRRTWSPDAFDCRHLERAKERSGSGVTVVVPARDEASTIEGIVSSIREALMDRHELVDELVVIDSDSSDGTAEAARKGGARVEAARDIRTDLGWNPGKGEAIWKSLFVTSGDILVFLDGDVTTFSPLYVSRLLGPLLMDNGVDLVKGFYDRDLDSSAKSSATQGGRVTELTARPLLALWWPELAGVIQPLAGEWAIRRSLLDRFCIPTGYGVEIAVLIDTLELRGLDAIAQVDLGTRGHSHQDLPSLGAMATEVLAAASRRRYRDACDVPYGIAHVRRRSDGLAEDWMTRPVNVQERPPVREHFPERGLHTEGR